MSGMRLGYAAQSDLVNEKSLTTRRYSRRGARGCGYACSGGRRRRRRTPVSRRRAGPGLRSPLGSRCRMSFHAAARARVEIKPSDPTSIIGPRWVAPKQPFASGRQWPAAVDHQRLVCRREMRKTGAERQAALGKSERLLRVAKRTSVRRHFRAWRAVRRRHAPRAPPSASGQPRGWPSHYRSRDLSACWLRDRLRPRPPSTRLPPRDSARRRRTSGGAPSACRRFL